MGPVTLMITKWDGGSRWRYARPHVRQPGDLFAGRFELERVVRERGGGAVWQARDRETGEAIALKVLTGTGAERASFEQEASAAASVAHPGLARHVGHGVIEDGERYLATAWIEGQVLAERLLRGALSLDDSLALGARVAEALSAVHAQGLVHGAIRPDNVLLAGGDPDRAALLDLGLVRPAEAVLLTSDGLAPGAPVYLAPEQVAGAVSASTQPRSTSGVPASVQAPGRSIGVHTDVFALGSLLYECVTGRPAFSGTYELTSLAKALVSSPPPVRRLREDAPEALEALVIRMLAKAPEARPPGCAEVIAVLREIQRRRAPELQHEGASAQGHEGERAEVDLLGSVPSSMMSRHVWLLLTVGPGDHGAASYRRIFNLATSFQASAHQLLDGSLLVRIDPERAEPVPPLDSPVEFRRNAVLLGRLRKARIHALGGERAARCALAVRAAVKGAPMALTMTPRSRPGEWLSGQALEWAAKLLARGLHAGLSGIIMDKESADVLNGEVFNVAGTGDLVELRGEWVPPQP